VFSSLLLLPAYYVLSILFSDTLYLCSSLIVTDQVSHPHRKQVKLWFYKVKYLERRREDKRLNRLETNISRIQSALNFFLNVIFFQGIYQQ